ncbi:hypothetical protein PC116_g29909, partial [Phytophthora cactorum]
MVSHRVLHALSPKGIHRDEERNRLSGIDEDEGNNIACYEEGKVEEQDRLLTSSHDGVDITVEAQVFDQRRSRWSVIAFTAACIGSIFSLAWVTLSLDILRPTKPSPLAAAQSIPLRRPDKDYILDPNWDFEAPSQVRKYDWLIMDKDGEPDGISKPMMTIDGQFPGPLVENGTNWMDGAAGVTQCPIAPGSSYRYRFNVTGQAGTYFYHGHQGVQALSGLVGPLVIHSRDEATHKPIPYSSDRVVLLQDWYYDSDSGLMRDVLSPGVEDAPMPNTALINGVNQADCSDHPNRRCSEQERTLPNLDLAPGEGHRLRFLNVGGFAWFQVAVDEHGSLPIIEVDGTAVEPSSTSSLVIAPG